MFQFFGVITRHVRFPFGFFAWQRLKMYWYKFCFNHKAHKMHLFILIFSRISSRLIVIQPGRFGLIYIVLHIFIHICKYHIYACIHINIFDSNISRLLMNLMSHMTKQGTFPCASSFVLMPNIAATSASWLRVQVPCHQDVVISKKSKHNLQKPLIISYIFVLL